MDYTIGSIVFNDWVRRPLESIVFHDCSRHLEPQYYEPPPYTWTKPVTIIERLAEILKNQGDASASEIEAVCVQAIAEIETLTEEVEELQAYIEDSTRHLV